MVKSVVSLQNQESDIEVNVLFKVITRFFYSVISSVVSLDKCLLHQAVSPWGVRNP